MARRSTAIAFVLALLAPSARAQAPTPTTRAEAIGTALRRGPRLGVARADTAEAYAQLLVARTRPNPTLSASYSRSQPQYHVAAELPLDLPGLRAARTRAAESGRVAARYRLLSAQAAVTLDADTTYTRAAAALGRLALSQRNAQAADSLRRIAIARRDAGDASDLDVELATMNAGQQANTLAGDSLTLLSAVLDLQAVMGLPADQPTVLPSDSLAAPPDEREAPASGVALGIASGGIGGGTATPLAIAAAQASLDAARIGTLVERRRVWAGPSLTAGFETGDPSGDERGVLPTVGVALPLPLLDRNRGPIALADAAHERARAELALAEVQSHIEIARARRELTVARTRVARDRLLVGSAERVATLSLTGYREGASPLTTVLEAQRNARDVLAQLVDDLASAWIAVAELRALTLAPMTAQLPTRP